MITVLPKAALSNEELDKICLWQTRICTAPTFCQYQTCLIGGTWVFGTGCVHCTIGATPKLEAAGIGPCNHCSYGNTPYGPGAGPGPCNHCTFGRTPYLTGTPWATCPHCSFIGTPMCVPGSQEAWVINDREDLVALRLELTETLEKLKDLEKTVPSGIQSKSEAAEIKKGLNEAIDHVNKVARGLKT